MQNVARSFSVLLMSAWLTACVVQTDTTDAADAADTPLNDGAEVIGVLDNDTLIAPEAPTLSIQAAPGALNFAWQDHHNDAETSLSSISLYEYDFRSEQEVLIDATIDPATTQHTVAITSHQLAWDSISYRIEICSPDNCLSSLRMPIAELLIDSVTPITPDSAQFSNSFGDHLGLNATGNIAVVTSPAQASVVVLFNVANQWIQASTLTSSSFTQSAGADMYVTTSASGDTIAVASIANNAAPIITVFDRLGENWVETGSIAPIVSNSATQSWFTDSVVITLSDNGDRLAMASHSVVSANDASMNNNQHITIFDRGTTGWVTSANLSIPAQHTRLPSFSGSSQLDEVLILSAQTGSLYLHQYNLRPSGWVKSEQQFIGAIEVSIDAQIASAANASEIVIAGWDTENSGRAAVAWRFAKTAGRFIATDSVRLPPVSVNSPTLRLAADASLSSIAIGWQAANSANIAFYGQRGQFWQHLFSVPDAFNLNRNLPLAQSLAISKDNSTAMVGTSNTGNGGLVSAFQ